MRANPPTGNDKSRLETCPLCDARYDPGKGHICGEEQASDDADIADADLQEEGGTALSLPQTPSHPVAENQATMLEMDAEALIAEALAKAKAAAPPPAAPPRPAAP